LRTRSNPPGLLGGVQRSDVDLLSRIKRCDPTAMGDLYDRYGKTAYNVILRLVPNEGAAEDLLAETFVTVWNQSARWKDARIEDLRLWVLLLARNHALEHLRSRNETLPKALPRLTPLTLPAVLQDFPRPRSGEEWERLRSAIDGLDETEAQILEMACFEGASASEIASNLGEPLQSVRDAIDSALQKLSEASRAG
jgi:RNA polymerase sigma-70 factor (ECF subfamily)